MEGKDETIDQSIDIKWYMLCFLSVRLENCSTKSAYNSFPRFTIERNITKSCLCNHISHTSTTATPWTGSRHRFAPPYLYFLINKKAKTSHVSLQNQRLLFSSTLFICFFVLFCIRWLKIINTCIMKAAFAWHIVCKFIKRWRKFVESWIWLL